MPYYCHFNKLAQILFSTCYQLLSINSSLLSPFRSSEQLHYFYGSSELGRIAWKWNSWKSKEEEQFLLLMH